MLWNETNFDVNIVPFTAQATKEKKWAFVSDYVHAYIIFHYGGIFLDTDVELLRPFEITMLEQNCFSGFETSKYIAPGLIFAGEKGCVIAKELMDFYSSSDLKQKNTELHLMSSPRILTSILVKYGLNQNNTLQNLGVITVYPAEYFCPKDFHTGIISITNNTYSIHHYDASWVTEDQRKLINERWNFYAKYNNDEFILNLVEQFEKLKSDYKVNNINSIPLRKLYKIIIKRTLKKLAGIIFISSKKHNANSQKVI